MSEKKNGATLAIMNQKNILMNDLIAQTETSIKQFAVATNKDYQKLIRSLILEVRILLIHTFLPSLWLKCSTKFYL
jgi:hypothetical protein